MTAPVAEVFSSVQGEGPFVGVRQVFVRTYGCDLRCRYCDTPASRFATGVCRIEAPPGSREWRTVDNPLSAEAVATLIEEFDSPRSIHHSVSLTGGEPLLHVEFVEQLARRCHQLGLQTYLETNGQRVAELKQLIGEIDIIAMDIKLPSSQPADSAFDGETLLTRSLAFLRVAQQKDVFVKTVVTPQDGARDVERVAQALTTVSPDVTLVLQPVTPARDIAAAPSPSQMLNLQALATRYLRHVRIIPQCHRQMNQL